MPSNRKRRPRNRQAVNGLPEDAYTFFSSGPFFSGADYEVATTEAERAGIWDQHRQTIIDRFRAERPELADLKTWGETLEGRP